MSFFGETVRSILGDAAWTIGAIVIGLTGITLALQFSVWLLEKILLALQIKAAVTSFFFRRRKCTCGACDPSYWERFLAGIRRAF